jgi:dTDP-4-dehydrorhamnose 3,5-epimerase
MRFFPTTVSGAMVIDLEMRDDPRGFFARMLCRDEFAAQGLSGCFVQWNDSFSASRGTLRGLHYQTHPHSEAKLVRCISGRVFDVVLDVRPTSSSFGCWHGVELTAANRRMLYLPEGCAHGYLTIDDATEVIYGVTAAYHPSAERGVRWDDPQFAIAWPDVGPLTVSEKDQQWPRYRA